MSIGMSMRECLGLGKDCGLKKASECLFNVELHAMSIFRYEDITETLTFLHDEYERLGWKENTSIADALTDLTC